MITLNFFSNLTLLIANCQPLDVIEEEYYWPFHFLDFGQSFSFALVEGIVLIACGYLASTNWSGLLMLVVNVGGTFVALLLFLLKAEFWEAPSHWIEYSVQMIVTGTSLAFVFGN